MLAIGNDELRLKPKIGEKIHCKRCGKNHIIKYGEKVLTDGTKIPSDLLAFYKCKGKSYLGGIDGREL